MSLEVLQFLWYLVFGIAVVAFIVLDGFDLGVGMVHAFAKTDRDRRIFLNAIGPVWDGNEVWLVIVGGALFAGFPRAYATLMSAYYVLIMVFIAGLMFRAVAIEVRSKQPMLWWRAFWDFVFSLGSYLITLILGLVLGNMVSGIPLNEQGDFTGSFGDYFDAFSIVVMVFTVFLFSMHGKLYLTMKTEGAIHDRVRKGSYWIWAIAFLLYLAVSVLALVTQPHMLDRFFNHMWIIVFPIVNLLLFLSIPVFVRYRFDGWAFVASCLTMVFLVGMFAIGMFPELLRSSVNPDQFSLTIANSLSSKKTLEVLLIIVVIGIPLALIYFASVYVTFRGKVRLDEHSY